jgi:hypothetical protein
MLGVIRISWLAGLSTMKPEYFLPVVILPWLWFFARLARTHCRTDRFLRQLYDNHRDIWESLDRPCGWQWSAPGRIANPFSMFSFRWAWLRHDPDWLERAPELREDFRRIREGFREWNFLGIPIMVGTALLFFLSITLLRACFENAFMPHWPSVGP